jgi:hypothetical protein
VKAFGSTPRDGTSLSSLDREVRYNSGCVITAWDILLLKNYSFMFI